MAYNDAMKRYSVKRYSWAESRKLEDASPTTKAEAQKLLDQAMANAKAEWLATRPPWYERWADKVQHIFFAALFVPVMLIASAATGKGIGG